MTFKRHLYPDGVYVLAVASKRCNAQDTAPALEGGAKEAREHGPSEAPEVEGVILTESTNSKHGEKVENEHEQEQDIRDGAEALKKALHNHLQLLHLAHKLKKPHETQ